MLSLGNKLTLNTQPIYKFVNKYSIDFDGVDDRIITDGADTVAQNTTYSFWCKSSTTTNNKGIFGHGQDNLGGFHFNYDGTRPLLYLGSSFFVYWNDTSAQDDGEWHHWVVYSDTNDLNNCKLYVDGVLQTVSSINSSGSLSSYTESLTIGSDRQVGGYCFEGNIDEFAVYDRELTQAEITRMYNTYYSPNRVANGNFSQIGNEEVTNGDFSQIGSEEVTGFTNGTTYPFTTFTTSGNNITSAIVSSAFAGAVSNAISVTSGKIYKVTFDYTKNSGDDLRVVFSSVVSGAGTQISNSELISASGSYTKYFTITSTTTGYLQMGTGNSGHSLNVSITNVSVKEVGQDWSFGTGWSMGDGKAVATSGTGSKLTQNISGLSGKSAEVTFTLSDVTSGGVIVDFGSTTSATISTNGTHTVYGTYDINQFELYKNGSFTGSVDNISVKEVGQHWTVTGTDSTHFVEFLSTGARFVSDTTSPVLELKQNVLTSGKEYKLTCNVAYTGAGQLRVNVGTNLTPFTEGANTRNFTATSNTMSFLRENANVDAILSSVVVQELKHDATNLMLNAGDYQSANPLITSTKSMEFDGTDDYLQLREPFSHTNHTICSWAYSSNLSATDFIFSASDSASDGIRLSYRSSANFRYEVNGQNIDTAADTREANKWYFVCGTYDGTTARLYVNGIELANAATSQTISTTTNARIGNLSYVDGNFFDGNITEVGAYNRALTSLEVASLYNQGMPTNLLVNRNNYQSGNPTVFNTKQVDFDGTDDHLKANSTLGSFTGSITSWVKRNSVASVWRYITDFRANSGGGYFAINNSHNIDVPSGTVYVDNVATTVVPQDTEWHHIVVTGITLNITESIIFGSRYNIVDVFDGDISQIGLWNSTLTADEVSSLYNHGLPIDLTTTKQLMNLHLT